MNPLECIEHFVGVGGTDIQYIQYVHRLLSLFRRFNAPRLLL